VNPQLAVLEDLLDWLRAGHRAALLTVCSTWPTSSRERGALCAIRRDGRLSGSVSGGLIEGELIDLVRNEVNWDAPPCLLRYGGEDARKRRLPRDATLEIALEPAPDMAGVERAVRALRERRVVSWQLDISTGEVRIEEQDIDVCGNIHSDGNMLRTLLRPSWRVLPVASEESVQAIRRVARFLNFEVLDAPARAGATFANGLDALTVVLVLGDAPFQPDPLLLDSIARQKAIVCLQTPRVPVEENDTVMSFTSAAKTPEEVAVAALAALVEIRAARLN
jgi:xanthine dehydrogenase accessory factor